MKKNKIKDYTRFLLVVVLLIAVIGELILRSPYVADKNGNNAMTYLMICEKRKRIQTKLIKCYANNEKCTTLKRNYFKKKEV